MSLKYNPQETTNMPTAGRLRPISAASVSGEKRQERISITQPMCGGS